MAWNQLYVVLFNNWRRRPATTKRRLRRRLDSWERLGSAFVAAPPLSKYSKLFIPRRPFLSSGTLFVPSHFIQAGGKIALRATEQTVEKGACHLYSVPRRTCLFYFFISAPSCRAESLMSESWINCFKPEGRATHHQTLPEMFYWRLLKLSHYTRWTNIGQQKEPNSVFSLLFMVSNHFREKLWMSCSLLVNSVSGLRQKIILVVSFFQRKSGTQETKHCGRGQHRGLAGANVLQIIHFNLKKPPDSFYFSMKISSRDL